MGRFARLFGAGAVAVSALATAALLSAPISSAHASEDGHAVFVQTNDPAGNAIAAYRQHAGGTLTFDATYPTGGRGGRETGSASDPLASQGSLVFDTEDSLLFAVNAGSNTISVFGVRGDTLHLRQVVWSGGSFPVSFARHGDLLYVLNAGLTGDVSGFRIEGGRLHPIAGSTRSLGLANASPPFFLSSPAQVGFTPSGRHLIVTTKTNGTVDVFSVNDEGRLSSAPLKNAVPGAPFAFRFDPAGRLALVNAGPSTEATYTVNSDGTLTPVGTPVSDGQAAACWIQHVRGFDYVANTGSGTISQFRVSGGGTVSLVNPTAASGIAGPTDLAAEGYTLYDVSGLSSSVKVFAVHAGGALALLQTVAVPDGASLEGIVAA